MVHIALATMSQQFGLTAVLRYNCGEFHQYYKSIRNSCFQYKLFYFMWYHLFFISIALRCFQELSQSVQAIGAHKRGPFWQKKPRPCHQYNLPWIHVSVVPE